EALRLRLFAGDVRVKRPDQGANQGTHATRHSIRRAPASLEAFGPDLHAKCPSVSGHCRIDLARPRVDAAAQVVEPREARAAEVLGRRLAAHAVMALEDERSC